MNNTKAELVIIQALWPGPELLAATVVKPSAILPSLSFNGAVGSVLARYASTPASRCSIVGVGGVAAAAAAPAAGCACTEARPQIITAAIVKMENSFFMISSGGVGS